MFLVVPSSRTGDIEGGGQEIEDGGQKIGSYYTGG